MSMWKGETFRISSVAASDELFDEKQMFRSSVKSHIEWTTRQWIKLFEVTFYQNDDILFNATISVLNVHILCSNSGSQ